MTNKKYVAAIDQGTTSTRCIIFDHNGEQAAVGQLEHEQIFPEKGWVEHDPEEIWSNTRRAVGEALANGDITVEDIDSVGITNQRETTVVWDRKTGKPVYNAIVWQDTRTSAICKELAGEEGPDKWRRRTGLLINSYPAGPKVKWILDNVDGVRERAEKGDLIFGTIDSWLLWNLTGGAEGDGDMEALHATDVTNASRTLLMDIEKLEWDEELCKEMGIPMSMLPEIRPSLGDFRTVRERGSLAGVPIRAILGDQQSAMFGQGCFRAGSAKNTYGTGLFLLLNTGTTPKFSDNGLLTTVCFQREGGVWCGCVLAVVARLAGGHQVLGIVSASPADGDDVVDFYDHVGGLRAAVAAGVVVSAEDCKAGTLVHSQGTSLLLGSLVRPRGVSSTAGASALFQSTWCCVVGAGNGVGCGWPPTPPPRVGGVGSGAGVRSELGDGEVSHGGPPGRW